MEEALWKRRLAVAASALTIAGFGAGAIGCGDDEGSSEDIEEAADDAGDAADEAADDAGDAADEAADDAGEAADDVADDADDADAGDDGSN